MLLYGCAWGWLNGTHGQGQGIFEIWGIIFVIIMLINLILQLILIFFDSSVHLKNIQRLCKEKIEEEDIDRWNLMLDDKSDDKSDSSITQKSVTVDEQGEEKDRYEFDSDEFEKEILAQHEEEDKEKIEAEKRKKELEERKASFAKKGRPESPRKGKSLRSQYRKTFGDTAKPTPKYVPDKKKEKKPVPMFPKRAPPEDPLAATQEGVAPGGFTPEAPQAQKRGTFSGADFSGFKKGTPKQDEKYYPDLKK